jgi:hypothetical protein
MPAGISGRHFSLTDRNGSAKYFFHHQPRRKTMPRKSAIKPAAPAVSEVQTAAPAEKKWAEPYRPVVVNAEAGFEFGENKLANRLVFSFAEKPSEEVRARLRHFGYFFDEKQKAWTANATAQTREIARRLVEEFSAGKGNSAQR